MLLGGKGLWPPCPEAPQGPQSRRQSTTCVQPTSCPAWNWGRRRHGNGSASARLFPVLSPECQSARTEGKFPAQSLVENEREVDPREHGTTARGGQALTTGLDTAQRSPWGSSLEAKQVRGPAAVGGGTGTHDPPCEHSRSLGSRTGRGACLGPGIWQVC